MLVLPFIICHPLRSTSSSMPTILKGGHRKQTVLIPFFIWVYHWRGKNSHPNVKFSKSEVMLILKGYFIMLWIFGLEVYLIVKRILKSGLATWPARSSGLKNLKICVRVQKNKLAQSKKFYHIIAQVWTSSTSAALGWVPHRLTYSQQPCGKSGRCV